MDIALLGAFLSTALLINMTPGPDMMYVMSRSISQGARAGIVSVLGIGIGSMLHNVLAAFGLSLVLKPLACFGS